MPMQHRYMSTEPSPDEVARLDGPTLLEFGAPWCGICQVAQPSLATALGRHGEVRHLKIEDGPRRRLGRAFRVKLWPTLIFLDDGEEVARLVRPVGSDAIEAALARITRRSP